MHRLQRQKQGIARLKMKMGRVPRQSTHTVKRRRFTNFQGQEKHNTVKGESGPPPRAKRAYSQRECKGIGSISRSSARAYRLQRHGRYSLRESIRREKILKLKPRGGKCTAFRFREGIQPKRAHAPPPRREKISHPQAQRRVWTASKGIEDIQSGG